jgi:Domain of unknown function (DUF3885)
VAAADGCISLAADQAFPRPVSTPVDAAPRKSSAPGHRRRTPAAPPPKIVIVRNPPMTNPPLSRESLHAALGPNAFALPLFYANEPALRFELSVGGALLDQFEQAWDRAREIVDATLAGAETLVAVVSTFAGDRPTRARALFRSLRDCGVRMQRPRAWWTEPHDDPWSEEDEDRLFVAFACGREAVHRLLWGALAVDLGVRPRLEGQLYLADPARGIVLHPYDDRGMDVASANGALLAEMYVRFGAYLLDYDRARMDGFFAARSERKAIGG